MSPAHVEAGRSIKNAVVNKAIFNSKRLELYGVFCLNLLRKGSALKYLG
jgi:hypothetical protein